MQLLKVHWFVVVEFISCNQAEKIWANDYVKSAGSRVERSRAVFCTCEVLDLDVRAYGSRILTSVGGCCEAPLAQIINLCLP